MYILSSWLVFRLQELCRGHSYDDWKRSICLLPSVLDGRVTSCVAGKTVMTKNRL